MVIFDKNTLSVTQPNHPMSSFQFVLPYALLDLKEPLTELPIMRHYLMVNDTNAAQLAPRLASGFGCKPCNQAHILLLHDRASADSDQYLLFGNFLQN